MLSNTVDARSLKEATSDLFHGRSGSQEPVSIDSEVQDKLDEMNAPLKSKPSNSSEYGKAYDSRQKKMGIQVPWKKKPTRATFVSLAGAHDAPINKPVGELVLMLEKGEAVQKELAQKLEDSSSRLEKNNKLLEELAPIFEAIKNNDPRVISILKGEAPASGEEEHPATDNANPTSGGEKEEAKSASGQKKTGVK